VTAVRELIFAEIERRLRTISGIAEVERMPSGDPAAFPALHIYDDGQKPGEGEAGTSEYDLTGLIEGFVEQPGGSAAHAALNELYAAAVAVLMVDQTLGDLAQTIEDGEMIVRVAHLASARRLGFALDFRINLRTRRGQPAQSA
jgi:hypothetical protein